MNNLRTDPERLQRIRIGSLAASATEVQLRALFLPYGQLVSFERPPDPNTGRPAAFVYIEMSAAEAEAAITALNGRELGGKVLDISPAKPFVGWMPATDRHPRSPRPRRTVMPPSVRGATLPGDGLGAA